MENLLTQSKVKIENCNKNWELKANEWREAL
jgi:hypothetical protein